MVHYGFLIPHRPVMQPLAAGPVRALEVQAARFSRVWPEMQPRVQALHFGLSGTVWHLGNEELLGTGVSLAPFLSVPLVTGKAFQLVWQGKAGVGLVSKPFHRTINHRNVAIGSLLNGFMAVSLQSHYRIHRHGYFTLGLGFNHFSNGAWRMPNLGINLPTVNTGLELTFGEHVPAAGPASKAWVPTKHSWQFWAATGLKEINPPGSPKYNTFTLGIDHVFGLGKHWNWALSANGYYDASIAARVTDDFEAQGSFGDNASLAMLGSIVFRVNELSIWGSAGVYAASRHLLEGRLVNRLAVRYFFSKHFAGNISVKTHKAKADFLEAGLVFRLKK